MADLPAKTVSTIVPGLRYRDAAKAVDWLCEHFGFERHLVVADDQGVVAHAQLTFGNGMIMLGQKRTDEYGRLIKQPDEIDGCETQCPYVIVSDADAMYERAQRAGCAIVQEIQDEDYGGRGFSCRDLEGRIWNFGSYDPWKAEG